MSLGMGLRAWCLSHEGHYYFPSKQRATNLSICRSSGKKLKKQTCFNVVSGHSSPEPTSPKRLATRLAYITWPLLRRGLVLSTQQVLSCEPATTMKRF